MYLHVHTGLGLDDAFRFNHSIAFRGIAENYIVRGKNREMNGRITILTSVEWNL